MPDHTVKQGDTLISIAHEHGFRDWEFIWQHASNASLREQRADPQVLVPGDVVHVPEKTTKEVEVATNERHSFVAKVLCARFEAVLRDESGNPLTNCRYQLEIEGLSRQGYTDDEARVGIDLPPDAKRGVLKVWATSPTARTLTWNLQLGSLEPIDTTAGVQARLSNLGFYQGKIDGQASDELRRALRDFQIVYGLELTGEADDATRAKLAEIHDPE